MIVNTFTIILLFNYFCCIFSSLFNNIIVNTHFTNVSQLKNHILKPSFYENYLKIIKANNIQFNPPINNLTEIVFPLNITYKCNPNIKIYPSKFSNMEILQKWNLNDYEFTSDIKTTYISFKVKIIPFNYYDNISLIFKGELIDKNFFVPTSIIKEILIDIEKIFQQLIHDKCKE